MKSKEIGRRIREFLDGKGLTQEQLASAIGMPKSSVSDSLNGKRDIDGLLRRISKKFELDEDYFKDGINEHGELTDNYKKHFIASAQAGLLTAEEGVDYEMQPIISQMPKYDYTVDVKGDSMFPEIKGGDIIACLDVTNEPFLQWGRTHILNTSQGVIVKKIFDDGNCIKCVSVNDKEFPAYSIPKDRIYSIGLVVGVLRF